MDEQVAGALDAAPADIADHRHAQAAAEQPRQVIVGHVDQPSELRHPQGLGKPQLDDLQRAAQGRMHG